MTIKPNKHNALQTLCSHSFGDFIDTLKGERQFKPSNQFRNRNWVRVGPSLPANAKFNQAIAVFNQGNALKRLKTLGRAVSVIEMAPPFQLVSAARSLLRPPPSIASGGRLFSYPRTKIF